jgi:uncharacterized LabA/DUF88 family protein
MASDDLRRQADSFVELAELGKLVGRERRAREDEDYR